MQTVTKREVSCKALELLFHGVRVRELEESILLNGIPYNLEYLQNKRERVDWWVWCKMISNIKQFFTQSDFEEMGRNFVRSGTYNEGLLWALFLFTSTKFSKIFIKQIFQIADSMFSCIKQNTEFIAENRIKVTAYWDEGYEYCPEWSFICKGVWEQLGAQIGQKGFKIDMSVAPRKTIFDVSWEIEKFSAKIKKVFRWLFSLNKALKELADSRDNLLYHYNKLETSQKLLQKQATQLKTAYEISTSIRQSLNINDTLSAVANSLISDGRFSFVSIRLNKNIDGNEMQITAEAGSEIKSAIAINQEIIINENKIGELTLHPASEMEYSECKELLEYLAPVINIAIHDALTLSAVMDYRDNLEKKVIDRTSELQKARDELTETNQLLKSAQLAQNRFFTNISHEFRTPLTLIIGPTKQLLQKFSEDGVRSQLDLIHRSAKKLNHLVDELLDISKIEAGEMRLKASRENILQIVEAIALPFHSLAERKNITFTTKSELSEIIVYIDKPKFEKILNNVLSNAFKFTPEGGKVEIKASTNRPKADSPKERTFRETISPPWRGTEGVGKEYALNDNFVEISIHDTGIGIPLDQLDKIFDRFYQVDSSHTRRHEGTGIGLSLTKELIELHHASIEVESEAGKGSTFRLLFPLGKEHLRQEEICEQEREKVQVQDRDKEQPGYELEYIIRNEKVNELAPEHFEIQSAPSLLIVEDNADVRKYITMILENQYSIIEAADGEEGLNKSFECIPNIIITDIMMPKMDGFQFCSKLKSDSRTSHIPIIMLTAKVTMEDKITGLDIGADEYIMKPFEEAELKARIKNLLAQRKRLHEHFLKYGLINYDHKYLNSIDKEFLHQAVDVINQHVSDTTFGVESFAEQMSISRSLLLKKTEALVGEPPSDLIKRIRLEKAALLLKNNNRNISEVALEVGFTNPSYFSECFRKQFGVNPSHYPLQNGDKN